MKDSKIVSLRYILSEKITRKQMLDTFKACFSVTSTDSSSEKVDLVDSFEWGLYENNLLAFRDENNDLKIWYADELFAADQAIEIPCINPQASFWWDFQAIPERTLLEKTLALRALIKMAEGVLKIEHFNLQDSHGKTVVFLQLVSFYRTPSARVPLLRQIKLTPLTGYQEQYHQALDLVTELGGFKPSLNPVDSLLGAIGVIPVPYSVKPDLMIEPSMSSREVANSLIAQMIEKQRLTEQGLIEDIDTEFLHHFRVAIRMTRAAIAQLKEVYPEQDVVMLKERFARLGRETNHLRDLDVFILDKSRYLNLLPASLADGLLPMFADFESDRVDEIKRIAKWLSSEAYKNEMEELEGLFARGYPACETPWSEKPAIELAVSKIMKRYKKIQKAALTITHDTPDRDIHSIRIDCKKLRYLLYFFGSLFDKKQLKQAGKQLKRLQDRLGIFNDLTVQEHYLETYLDAIEHKQKKDIYLIASLGGLIAILYKMKLIERENSINELHVFSSKENRQLFSSAFALKGPEQ